MTLRPFIAAICVLLAACDLIASKAGAEVPGLESLIRSRAEAAAPGDTISLADLAAEYPWTDLVVVGPYPENDDFERVAGFAWSVATAGSLSDESNTLALIAEGQVLAYASIRGDIHFLAEEDTAIKVARVEAVFRVVVDEDGVSRRLDLVQ
jgi:hypothetical protein